MGSHNNSGANPHPQMKTRGNGHKKRKCKDGTPDATAAGCLKLTSKKVRKQNLKAKYIPVPAPAPAPVPAPAPSAPAAVDTNKTQISIAPLIPPPAPALPKKSPKPSATLPPSLQKSEAPEIEVIQIDDDNEDDNMRGLVRIAPLESLREPEERMQLGVTAPDAEFGSGSRASGSGLNLFNGGGPVLNSSLPSSAPSGPIQTNFFNESRNVISQHHQVTHAQSNAGIVNNVQVCNTNPIDKVVSGGTMQTVYQVNSHSQLQSNCTQYGNVPQDVGICSSSSQSPQYKVKINSETGNIKIVKVASVTPPKSNSSEKASSSSSSASVPVQASSNLSDNASSTIARSVSVPVQTSPTAFTSSSSTNFNSVVRNSHESQIPRFISNANTSTKHCRRKVSLHLLNPDDYPTNPNMQKRIKRSIATNTYRERKIREQELQEENNRLQETVHILATRLLDIQRSVNVPLLDPKMVIRGGRNASGTNNNNRTGPGNLSHSSTGGGGGGRQWIRVNPENSQAYLQEFPQTAPQNGGRWLQLLPGGATRRGPIHPPPPVVDQEQAQQQQPGVWVQVVSGNGGPPQNFSASRVSRHAATQMPPPHPLFNLSTTIGGESYRGQQQQMSDPGPDEVTIISENIQIQGPGNNNQGRPGTN